MTRMMVGMLSAVFGIMLLRGAVGEPVFARCDVQPNTDGAYEEIPEGIVLFHQESPEDSTHIRGVVRGFIPGSIHGFHVHTSSDDSGNCGSDHTGGHYNPLGTDHGAQTADVRSRHVGDLGNITANMWGEARIQIQDPLVDLSGGYSVIGRSIVIHEDPDDAGQGGYSDSLTTGHAGSRIACCTIEEIGADGWENALLY